MPATDDASQEGEMITKVAFVAHPTRDLEAAKRFYRETLGFAESADYGEHWYEVSAPDGTTIALDTATPKFSDSPTPYMALETDDIDAEVARLREAGATIEHDPWTNEAPDGKELCKMAIVLDPDGNSILLHEIASWRA